MGPNGEMLVRQSYFRSFGKDPHIRMNRMPIWPHSEIRE